MATKTTTPNYDIDYNDKRLTSVTAEEKTATTKSNAQYDKMAAESDKVYQDTINKYGVQDKDGNWNEGSMADIQTDLANKQTEFAIEKIEQDKEWLKQDYTKEQAGAYADWKEQSGAYGVEAEKQAAAGLAGSGYGESSQVRMYTAYQNRVAVARDSFIRATQAYDNAITEARLQNSSVLAEIALETYRQTTALAIEGLQYKNTLLTEKANRELQLKTFYHTKYQDVLKQINADNAMKEEVRQANLAHERQQEQIKIAQAELKLQQDKFAYEKAQDAKAAAAITKSSGGSSSGSKSGSSGGSSSSSNSKKGGAGGKISTSKTSTGTATATKKSQNVSRQIDMQSVLNLGLGPISASKLNSLVASGYVKEVAKGNKVTFQWTAAGLKHKQMYSSLG